MDKKRLMVIVNPISGTRSKTKKLGQALKELDRAGFEVELRETLRAGHATELAAEAADRGFHGAVACGGDGTVNETAKALCGTDTVLGIIPAGSGNGLARHIEIPMDGRGAAKIIAADNILDCDYATVNGTPFFCTCGLGFDAAVSMRFASKKRRGLAMYVKSALDEFAAYSQDRYTIEVDGVQVSRQALMVDCCNASQFGNNAFIAPMARITDGVFDLVVVHPRNIMSKAIFGVEMMTGLVGKDAKVDIYRGRKARVVRSKAGPAHIDGEPLTMPDVLDFEIHPGQIKMFANPSKRPFKPFVTPFKMTFGGLRRKMANLFS